MDELYNRLLKTGEQIVFRTNMPKEEIQCLPVMANQYSFYQYFLSRGYELEIHLVIKKGPGAE